MIGRTCPTCGAPLRVDAAFCPKCGATVATTAASGSTPPLRIHHGKTLRRIVGATVAVVVAITVILVYLFGYYLPAHNVVMTGGGSWIVNGASTSLGIGLSCSNCGQRVPPGGAFTVDITIYISSQSCGFFGCSGYTIQSFSVNSPYTLVRISPSNLPYTDYAGDSNTWALSLTAPESQGHSPLGGVVAVSFV
jgi:hypothetical protein